MGFVPSLVVVQGKVVGVGGRTLDGGTGPAGGLQSVAQCPRGPVGQAGG